MSGRVAILGLGRRGLRWAEACMRAGWEVSCFDPDDRSGLSLSESDFRREPTISATVRRADWVICCLPERLELIQMVIQRVQAEASDTAVLAVSSFDHDVEELQGCAIRPGQVVRVQVAENGGVALDVSSQNCDAFREKVTETLADLAVVFGLEAGENAGDANSVSKEA